MSLLKNDPASCWCYYDYIPSHTKQTNVHYQVCQSPVSTRSAAEDNSVMNIIDYKAPNQSTDIESCGKLKEYDYLCWNNVWTGTEWSNAYIYEQRLSECLYTVVLILTSRAFLLLLSSLEMSRATLSTKSLGLFLLISNWLFFSL